MFMMNILTHIVIIAKKTIEYISVPTQYLFMIKINISNVLLCCSKVKHSMDGANRSINPHLLGAGLPLHLQMDAPLHPSHQDRQHATYSDIYVTDEQLTCWFYRHLFN